MTVVPQTYTATGTWTAVQLADTFKQAFIDAGLMADWFDTFLSGTIENRVLRVINNGAKTYGTVYYWFMFTTTGAFIATTNTWNATTHVPTGTAGIDYASTTTNATTNHATLLALTSTTTCTVTRYTSGVSSSATLFLIRNGSSNATFMLSHPSYNASAYVDQDKVAFNSVVKFFTTTGTNATFLTASQIYHLRSSYLGSMCLRGHSTYVLSFPIYQYAAPGNSNNTSSNYTALQSGNGPSVILPTAENNANTALGADHLPMFTAPTVSPYMAALPSDFGIVAYYASNAMAVQDTFVVSSGTEEWEMIVVANNATNVDAGKLMLCARIV
jgi:hypothetical protein